VRRAFASARVKPSSSATFAISRLSAVEIVPSAAVTA
jgi:hypothetical protein